MLWNELSEWCKTWWQLTTKCQLCSQQKWQMTVEEWFSTSHLSTTWALLSLKNTPLTGLYILVQGSQLAFENQDAVWQHIKGDHLCYFLRQFTRLPGKQWVKSLIDDCFCSSLLTTSANSTGCLFCRCCFRFTGVLLYIAIPDGFIRLF